MVFGVNRAAPQQAVLRGSGLNLVPLFVRSYSETWQSRVMELEPFIPITNDCFDEKLPLVVMLF